MGENEEEPGQVQRLHHNGGYSLVGVCGRRIKITNTVIIVVLNPVF